MTMKNRIEINIGRLSILGGAFMLLSNAQIIICHYGGYCLGNKPYFEFAYNLMFHYPMIGFPLLVEIPLFMVVVGVFFPYRDTKNEIAD